jgi:L-threonylcarbamoyladenylate synthase
MTTDIIALAHPEALVVAAQALSRGLVVALPTDTVYGLAVDPDQPGALARLFALKGRPWDVPVPVLVGTPAQVTAVAASLGSAASDLAGRFWPGPLTLVVPRASGFTADLGGPRSTPLTVGVRWPDHPVVERLCGEIGPLAVTSANLHGSPPATTSDQVVRGFPPDAAPAVIVDGGSCDRAPSTVVECVGPTTRCRREGAIPWSEILKVLSAGSAPA